jgi:hypothetical protein
MSTLTMKIVTVTPGIADEWLKKNNPKNRSIGRNHVARLTADMKAGRWHLTHQGIAFDADGQLVDGQHRLTAVMQSGATVEMAVFFYEGKAPPGIDMAKSRSFGDELALSGRTGKEMSKRVAAACVAMRTGLIGSCDFPPRSVQVSIFEIYGDEIESVLPKTPSSIASIFAAAFAYARGVSPAEVDAFMIKLFSRVGFDEKDPERLLDRYISSFRSRDRTANKDAFYKTLRCIKARLEGEKISKLQAPSEGEASAALRYFDRLRKAKGLPVGIPSLDIEASDTKAAELARSLPLASPCRPDRLPTFAAHLGRLRGCEHRLCDVTRRGLSLLGRADLGPHLRRSLAAPELAGDLLDGLGARLASLARLRHPGTRLGADDLALVLVRDLLPRLLGGYVAGPRGDSLGLRLWRLFLARQRQRHLGVGDAALGLGDAPLRILGMRVPAMVAVAALGLGHPRPRFDAGRVSNGPVATFGDVAEVGPFGLVFGDPEGLSLDPAFTDPLFNDALKWL